MEHRILRMWLRQVEGGPMLERAVLELQSGRGIVGDHTFGRLRHVTLVFADDWHHAEVALGKSVDPAARRANVLLSGGDGPRLVGRDVQLGGVRLEIRGVTNPCPGMDVAAPGLMEALRPQGRGGVWGRVLDGGTLRAGTTLQTEPTDT